MEDTVYYRYCQVTVAGVDTPYAYRTEDDTLTVGDAVRVPFGRYDTVRVGRIAATGLYTAEEAPFPPEKTKFILGRDDGTPLPPPKPKTRRWPARPPQPADIPSAEPTSPAVESAVEPEEPPVPDETTDIPAATPEDTPPTGSAPDAAARPLRRRRLIGWLAAAVAAGCLCIGGILGWYALGERYRLAADSLLAGDYATAAQTTTGLPALTGAQRQCKRVCAAAAAAPTEDPDTLRQHIALYTAAADNRSGLCREGATQLLESENARLNQILYDLALERLKDQHYSWALSALEDVSQYRNAAQLRLFAQAGEAAEAATALAEMESAYKTLDAVPADYAGDCAAEIRALRDTLHTRIEAEKAAQAAAAKAEADRIAALKASGLPYVGMDESEVTATRVLGKPSERHTSTRVQKSPKRTTVTITHYNWYSTDGQWVFSVQCEFGKVVQAKKVKDACWNGDRLLVQIADRPPRTFGNKNASDTTSRHTLRDDYDSPEDLFEDGDYDDLDEAWDEWEDDG